MSTLYALQRATYHAAGDYHAALSVYFIAMTPEHRRGRKEAAERSISAAKEYRARLSELLEYVLTTGAGEVEPDEPQRISRNIELLDFETERIRDE